MLIASVDELSDPGVGGLDSFRSSDLVSGDMLALPNLSLAFRRVLAALLPRLIRSEGGFSSPSSAGVELRDDAREWLVDSDLRSDLRLAAAALASLSPANWGRCCE